MGYVPIRIGTIRPWQPVGFDIFIKVSERYLHYIRKGDPFDGNRIDSLKKKSVKKLFIPTEAESEYLAYLDSGLEQLSDTKLGVEDRALVAKDSMMMAAENAAKNVETAKGYERTQEQVKKVTEFLVGEKGAMRQMMASSGVAMDVFHHSSNVVTLSVNLAAKLGIEDAEELKCLGLAALLHDMGKEGDGLDPLLPREQLSAEQLKIYHSHPMRAVAKLQDKPYVNGKVLELIMNHEEVGDGAGFPEKKRLITLSKIQQILNLANEYDRVCTVNKTPPLEAMKQFYLDKLGLFDLKLLEAFSKSIQP